MAVANEMKGWGRNIERMACIGVGGTNIDFWHSFLAGWSSSGGGVRVYYQGESDCVPLPPSSSLSYLPSLRSVLSVVQGDGTLVVIGPTLIRKTLRPSLDNVREKLREECEGMGGIYVTARGLGLCSDGIHLNGRGTKGLARRIREAFVEPTVGEGRMAAGDFGEVFDRCVVEGRRRAALDMTGSWGGWRGKGDWRMANYTYGEIDRRSVVDMLEASGAGEGGRGKVTVADLGCGTGKVLLAAIIWGLINGVEVSVVGVDRMDAYVKEGRESVEALKEQFPCWKGGSEFITGDFVERSNAWRGADVVVCCSTCYDEMLMNAIEDKVKGEGKEGQLVFTLDKKLGGKEEEDKTPLEDKAAIDSSKDKATIDPSKDKIPPTPTPAPTPTCTPPPAPNSAPTTPTPLTPALIGVTEAFGSWGLCVGYLHRMVKPEDKDAAESESTSTNTLASRLKEKMVKQGE
ncbi:hypothetical protein TrCOL_g10892 [Triparma columacea]|uniref:Methyltransferase domain-containing protein n=1 Tax=Triparma columacea TaxID=722753 RepID=A0A9W7L8Z8_9STRA|nr:hypothetical protein TrCOL_g10892 [Triparma columacea]